MAECVQGSLESCLGDKNNHLLLLLEIKLNVVGKQISFSLRKFEC